MILLLHRAPALACEYANWLEGCSDKVFLIISGEINKPNCQDANLVPLHQRYSRIIFLDNYDDNEVLMATINALGVKNEFTHVIAPYEFDLMRAAELRKNLGLGGQRPESASAFRDKLKMKQIAGEAGLLNNDFAPVRNWDELAEFHAKHEGNPVILKPRSGAASRGVLKIDDPVRQRKVIEEQFSYPLFISPNFIVEQFIEGDVFHIDGLVLSGHTVLMHPSRYIIGSLDFQGSAGHTISSAMLDPQDDLVKRLNCYVSKLLAALPTPENCTFHCEVFVTDGGDIELCEIASRTGGVRIKHAIERAFGIDIAKAWLRAELSLPQDFSALPECPIKLTGWATMAGRKGKVQRIPENCNVPGVYGYQKVVSVGDSVNTPRSAVDYIANCDIEGPDFASVSSCISSARSWFYSEFSVV